jgi:shikimate kinase
MASSPASEHVVLVGLMATGKSTVGRAVAEHLGRPFLDSDHQVELRTGQTVKEIFEAEGEDAFRRYEAQALADALTTPMPAVIAAAGGVVLDISNRDLLRDPHVIWLRADPELLAERVDRSDHRPLLADDPRGVLQRMSAERYQLYAQVADDIIDVDELTQPAVAARILELLR